MALMKAAGKRPGDAVMAVLDQMSYEWLSVNAPDLLVAIELELNEGTGPDGIRFLVQRHVGPDREGLALRCQQAARYMERMEAV